MLQGLVTLATDPWLLLWLVAAVPIGMAFGAIPGLGGKIALISVMPFLAGFDLVAGCVFLISLHAVVHTGAAVPTILLGIPGTGPSTAVVLDGHAMARRGEATRAMTAAAVASAIGGVIGAIVLAAIAPFALGLMKLVSYPEIFLLTVFGLIFSATLSGQAMVKGLVAGCLGLTLAFVGIESVFGVHRLTYGAVFLWDGMDLVVAVLALYAIPEMMDLAFTRKPVAAGAGYGSDAEPRQIRTGLLDMLRHRWLVFRTSMIGAIVGIIPGLGGDVAAWLCYGHAVQTSRTPERFGHGAVEGVIGPEAANNSKEGGALIPTLFLGIPGSSGMAILLVALVPLGVSPGPHLALQFGDIVWVMVSALVLSNILAAVMLVLMASRLNALSRVDPVLIIPFVYLLALASAYISTAEWQFLALMAVLSLVGYALMRQRWPRAPFVIGLILGPAAEDALIKSLSLWGPAFLFRPVSILLIVFLVATVVQLARRLSGSSAHILGGHDEAR
jgi:putative tricarboxylic transport membrane protein